MISCGMSLLASCLMAGLSCAHCATKPAAPVANTQKNEIAPRAPANTGKPATRTFASLADLLALPEHAAVPVKAMLPAFMADWATASRTRAEAVEAATILQQHEWKVRGQQLKPQWDARAVTAAGKAMKFVVKRFGTAVIAAKLEGLQKSAESAEAAPVRWPLYISMHGGGQTSADTNDGQWQNQIGLYQPADGLYIAPRAPTDTWNLWHEAHMDPLLVALIDAAVMLENVDPDRVYLMGYSAGGDGVYQLAPRMADHFGAAAMMAGHPNDVSPLGLRNLPIMLQVGVNDNAFDRANVAKRFGEQITKLHDADSKGYSSVTKLHEGKGHWMDWQDAAAVPWMAEHKRNLWPDRVVWKQSGVTHPELYWLALPASVVPMAGALVTARVFGQTITLTRPEPAGSIPSITILLNDRLVDLDKPVKVMLEGEKTPLFEGSVKRTIADVAAMIARRSDYGVAGDVPVAMVTVGILEKGTP